MIKNLSQFRAQLLQKQLQTGTIEQVTIDVPQVMLSAAFCYGMVLFYHAALKISATSFKDSGTVQNYTISTLQTKLQDVIDSQNELKGAIQNAENQDEKDRLQSQLDILNTQEQEIQSFISNPNQIAATPLPNLSELESTIISIEDYVKKIYEGITISKEDLVDIQTVDEIFTLVFEKIINRASSIKSEIQNLFSFKELNKIHESLKGTIKKEKTTATRSNDTDRASSLSFFNANSVQIIKMLNQFLLDNLAEVIVANIGQSITFPIAAEDLTKNLAEDPLAIFRNGAIEISPGVYGEMVKDDLLLYGKDQDPKGRAEINNGTEFEEKIFKFILDEIIVVNTESLEKHIVKIMQGRDAKGFAKKLNQVNSEFDVPVMKNILIVDDNIATGATLSIIANEINKLVTQHNELNFDIVTYPTKGTIKKRSVDRQLFDKMDALFPNIPAMDKKVPRDKKTKLPTKIGKKDVINVDSLLKNIVCLTPIII